MGPRGFVYFPCNLDSTENLEKYTPGGYHTVELGQLYDDDRYKVIHKLGSGGFSTIWLARDRHQDRYVALKIVCADSSDSYDLHPSVKSIVEGSLSHLCVTELRRFYTTGPNGRHLCQVLPVMGPSLLELSNHRHRLGPAECKMLARQAVEILAELHANNLCHGDFTPPNLLLGLSTSLDHMSEDEIYSLLGHPKTDGIGRYGDEYSPGPSAPNYVVEAVDLARLGPQFLSDRLYVADFDQMFASATSSDMPPNPGYNLGTPLLYRAPEVYIDGTPGPASDIWALGCTLFRMRSGLDLLNSWHFGLPMNIIDETFSIVGKPTRKWKEVEFRNGWPSGSPQAAMLDGGKKDVDILRPDEEDEEDCEDEDLRGKVYKIWDEAPSDIRVAAKSNLFWDCPEDVLNWSNVEEGFPHISHDEAKDFLDLLQRTFEYELEDRITARDVLKHRWLTG